VLGKLGVETREAAADMSRNLTALSSQPVIPPLESCRRAVTPIWSGARNPGAEI
jgi:hypothetical protein